MPAADHPARTADQRLLGIGEVARRSGVSVDTLRFYEREGLIPHPDRDSGGRRRFDTGVLDQLAVIRALRQVGVPLADVRDLLQSRGEGGTVAARVAAARASLERLDTQLDHTQARVDAARGVVRGWLAELDAGEPWPETPIDC